MNNERDNKEWLNEYPELSKVNPANAFKEPVNYFEETEGKIMNTITLANLLKTHPQGGFALPANYFDELTPNIKRRIAVSEIINKSEGFTVPENYFDELLGNIQSRVAIDELLNTGKGFTVPKNYFDELSGNIQSRVAIDELLNTEKGFMVPENYFEDLSQNIEARIAVDELITEEQGFTVPTNYFANLEARILQNTIGIQAPATKSKPIVRKLWATNVFKYATAACFSLFVGAAIMVSEFNDSAIHNRSDVHKALAKVSNSDIEAYLELNGDSQTVMDNSDPKNLNSMASDDSQVNN